MPVTVQEKFESRQSTSGENSQVELAIFQLMMRLGAPSPVRGISSAEAQAWAADLTVMARSQRRHRAGDPYVGSETAHVLEFTEQPVLVVPRT